MYCRPEGRIRPARYQVGHDERGRILLVDTAEPRMRPTWVLPDDTRDGLRAAGLSGDKFELARR